MKNLILGIILLLAMLVWLICRWPIEVVAAIICAVEPVRGDDNTPIADRLMNSYDGLIDKIIKGLEKHTN